MSYSQSDEERVILELVDGLGIEGAPGFRVVLDVGAHDGQMFSNSRALLERRDDAGRFIWGGLLVEPCPEPAGRAVSLYADRSGARPGGRVGGVDVVVAALVADPPRRNGLRFEPLAVAMPGGGPECDGVSTLDDAHREKWDATVTGGGASGGGRWGEVLVPVVGWPVLFRLAESLGAPPSVVSLDVEGTNRAALESFVRECLEYDDPMSQLKRGRLVRVLCVEKDEPADGDHYRALLAPYGFEQAYESAENCVFGRR